jgi:hypothetical protein
MKRIILERHEKFRAEIEAAKRLANVRIVWPPDMGITPITRNSSLLARAAREAALETLSVFQRMETPLNFYKFGN